MTTRIALLAIFMSLTQITIPPLVATSARAESSEATAAEQEMFWRERAGNLRAEQAATERHYREAERAYLLAQHRKQLIKGAQRQAIIDEYDAAKEALAKAEKALADLPEEARRAGAAPGWIRE